MSFILKGQCKSGKNNMIVLRNGMHIPKKDFVEWRAKMVKQIYEQRPPVGPIDQPCSIDIRYVPGDLRTRDIPGMVDALFHVLEYSKTVRNDFLFKNLVWKTLPLDRENPAVAVHIDYPI